ncbi:DUF883 family protein [Pandoraea sputorum]|uniref:Bacterial protein of uncharacterized function (DUF883) n=1 Tax=Pandoraea sputorum TaxID=93222 RepID=A0A239SKP2_9BURK|nr:DUF883 family protein [Pandoraea sputorum]AJC17156.1 hypothetical protein NA29_16335 [Pandoraea sputorum]BET09861.1 hypothetical protein THI4931_09030 [Pandoraea sputorum]SNU85354.1 Bacterial protein of uncharacterised function (DUF883) [Pandoraea sputorum]VVD85054.1 hypothetical protein PSP20601_01315 [Pandoraea sputorum]
MNDTSMEHRNQRQTLINDADALLADVKALLKDLADEASLEVGQANPSLGARLQNLTAHLEDLRKTSRQTMSEWATVTDGYVHAHPWKALAATASVAAVAAAAGAIAVPKLVRRRARATDGDVQL